MEIIQMARPRKIEPLNKFDGDNVFNIDFVDDLPNECRREVCKVQRFNEKTGMLIKLFGIKPILMISEIVAGMYRVHNAVVTRQWVTTTCTNLVGRGLLQKQKTGVFKNILE